MEALSFVDPAAYQELLPQMKISFTIAPQLPQITYDAKEGIFYMEKEQATRQLESSIEMLENDITFARSWYFTNFKGLTNEIARRVISKHTDKIIEKDGTLNLNKKLPRIPYAIQKYKLDEFVDEDEYYTRIEKLIRVEGRLGYFEVRGTVRGMIDEQVPLTSHARDMYKKVLETRIGSMKVAGVLQTVLGDRSTELVERGLGWGTTLFTYAAEAGLEKEVEREFIERVKNVYDNTYGVAKDYFSKTDGPAEAHVKAFMSLQKANVDKILYAQLSDDDCLAALKKATLDSCENLMQDPPSSNLKTSPTSPVGRSSYSMII